MNPKPQPIAPIKRLPVGRKAVTFIVGLKCKDGVVLCSDSLEADGYNKRMVQKLFKFEVAESWGVAFGCSGGGAACSSFGDRLLELLSTKTVYDRRATEKLVEATMSYMKSEYPNELLDVIVALWGANPEETRLYKAQSHTQCLYPEPNYACAGLDVSLARFLLDSAFMESAATTTDALYLAAFITSVMKEKADGVGGPTQLLGYRVGDKGWKQFPSEAIAKIEDGGFLKGKLSFAEFEMSIRHFLWSRFPHEYRPEPRK